MPPGGTGAEAVGPYELRPLPETIKRKSWRQARVPSMQDRHVCGGMQARAGAQRHTT